MARKTMVRLVDDFDGGDADGTHRVVLDGRAYEFDLSKANWQQFVDTVEPYLKCGRRVATGGRNGTPAQRRAQSAKERAWAKANGFVVSDHGRVPAHVRAAFNRSQQVEV